MGALGDFGQDRVISNPKALLEIREGNNKLPILLTCPRSLSPRCHFKGQQCSEYVSRGDRVVRKCPKSQLDVTNWVGHWETEEGETRRLIFAYDLPSM